MAYMQLPQWLARFNRYVTNPIQRLWAGWAPGMGILEHAGRKSGKQYRTPLNVFPTEDGVVIARKDGDDDAAILDAFPLGRERVGAALRNPNAGEVLVSAAPGWELADLAGMHHSGGGSHGSLGAGDSEVPMLGIGIDPPPRTVDVKDAMLAGVLSPVP